MAYSTEDSDNSIFGMRCPILKKIENYRLVWFLSLASIFNQKTFVKAFQPKKVADRVVKVLFLKELFSVSENSAGLGSRSKNIFC